LEGGGTVGHSEEHYKGFKEATIGMEGCLPFVSGLDLYIIETPSDIKLGEVLGSVELGDEFRDEGEGVPVLDGDGVQRAIVLDQPERTILLFNEEYWGCDGGLGGSDPSGMQVLLQKSIQLCLLQWGQGVDLQQLGLCSGDQFNSMIPLAVLRQYVEVFFGGHGLELRDVGRQQSGVGLRLFAMSGSLREMLGCCSHSLEVGLGELREEAHKEESVPRLPIRGIRLRSHFFKFFYL